MDRQTFQLLPSQASTFARQVDLLNVFLAAVSLFFTLLIFSLILLFAIKYRRRNKGPPPLTPSSVKLEIIWTLIPLAIVLVMFVWGALLYADASRPPADAIEIYVVAKQWMWKIQHPEGAREINELHLPVDQDVVLTLTSQDVVHDFSIPAFRTKRDAVPGRYTQEWFHPTQIGQFRFYCDQYCGNQHANMTGTVIVMSQSDYNAWLNGVTNEPPAVSGARLFESFGCAACHGKQAPTLAGLYQNPVNVYDPQTGKTQSVVADDNYLRQSIVNPNDQIVQGYSRGIMPSFQNRLSEEQLIDVIAYVKSLQYATTQRVIVP